MLDGSNPALLLEWFEYFNIEPFGEERADIRNAILCQLVANAAGVKKQGGGKFKIEDFMPTFTPPERKFNSQQFKALMKRHYGNNRKSRRKPDSKNR
jgi:hypothetical protein